MLIRCPIPIYKNYKAGKGFTFKGSISQVYSAEKGIIYVLNDESLEDFTKIEDHKPLYEFKQPPKVGELFFYLHKGQFCYRAYRISSNSANENGIRAYLVDYGVVIFKNFQPNTFFKLRPVEFYQYEPMALCCCVESYPESEKFESKSDFLNKSIAMTFNFEVMGKVRLYTALGPEKICLTVKVTEIPEAQLGREVREFEGQDKLKDAIELKEIIKYSPRLTYSEDGSFPVDLLTINPTLPQPGDKILVYPTEIDSLTEIHGGYAETGDFTYKNTIPEFLSLMIWMNKQSLIETYKGLKTPPAAYDMVIVLKQATYYRGVVTGSLNSRFTVFFIDYGSTSSLKLKYLYRFPKEFAQLPAQAVSFLIANMAPSIDKNNEERKVTMKKELLPVAVGEVISSCHQKWQPQMMIKLYDQHGVGVANMMGQRLYRSLMSR